MSEGKTDSPIEHDEIAVKDVPGATDAEMQAPSSAEEAKGTLKLDQYGYALVPQPSNFKDDPLVRRFHRFYLAVLYAAVLYISGF